MILKIGLLLILILQQSVIFVVTKKIQLNALGISYSDDSQFYTALRDEFYKYAQRENLDIEINLTTVSNTNSTASPIAFKEQLSVLHKKKNKKYDLFFYDNQYIKDLDKYFVDLSNYIEEEHINQYDSNILSLICYENNKLIGLPVTVSYTVLYSNRKLLKKYNKEIPRTWDELINTGKEIFEEEFKLDPQTNLTIYNGLFNDHHTTSFYEFIYSYRKEKSSPFPQFNSHKLVMLLR